MHIYAEEELEQERSTIGGGGGGGGGEQQTDLTRKHVLALYVRMSLNEKNEYNEEQKRLEEEAERQRGGGESMRDYVANTQYLTQKRHENDNSNFSLLPNDDPDNNDGNEQYTHTQRQ